jgi:hypothetical protein
LGKTEIAHQSYFTLAQTQPTGYTGLLHGGSLLWLTFASPGKQIFSRIFGEFEIFDSL